MLWGGLNSLRRENIIHLRPDMVRILRLRQTTPYYPYSCNGISNYVGGEREVYIKSRPNCECGVLCGIIQRFC